MLVPFRNSLSTDLYSSCFFSLLLVLPTFRPSRPPSAIYFALPLKRRNFIFSRSNSAHVERVAYIIGAKIDGFPSVSNKVNCSFCIYKLILLSISSFTVDNTSNAFLPKRESSETSNISTPLLRQKAKGYVHKSKKRKGNLYRTLRLRQEKV